MRKTIELKNVAKSFKKQEILKNINFSCFRGEIIGIVGVNGSGKSVLFKVISGLLFPDKGSVTIMQEEITKSQKIPQALSALIEEPGFLPNLTGYQNLELLASIRRKITKEDILDTLRTVRLFEDRNKKTKHYSLGMKKKLGIAQAIMEKPKIILLDEPMNALDKKSVEDMRNLFLNLAKDEKVTIVIASHNLDDINLLCDKVYQLKIGQLAEKENSY
ncbi:MAG: ABC transporter ATP-binding protein [Streptococcaceae bacterium]|jgi:ABC-2 type transport system ATP-binding protein|nr:ABC transporter ATP-binding protein [Streptococcaceae bacterium]